MAGSSTEAEETQASSSVGREETSHIRGSTLLVFGRFIGLGLDFITQVLIVRALTKSDYGAFAFALAVVSLGSTAGLLGLDKTIGRFVAFYQEEHDDRRVMGTIVMSIVAVAAVSLAIVLAVVFLVRVAGIELVEAEQARDLLLILILLTPSQALDSLLSACFAVFASPRAIFFRRYVIGPLLQLSVVVVVLLAGQPAPVLAAGYVIAGLVGTLLYLGALLRKIGHEGLFERVRPSRFVYPLRSIFGFSLPLLSSDIVFVLRTSAIVILLQYLGSSEDVASYRAVLPVARQNLLVYQSFAFLFVPVASRLFARHESARLRDLYWSTAAWIAIASFPALALSFSLADSVTPFLFGSQYATSGIVLAILAIGQYFSAALGFNALVLRVHGRIRWVVGVDVATAVGSLLLSLVLIDQFQAVGAAVATSMILVVQNLLYQAGATDTAVGLPDRSQLRTYASIAVTAVALFLIQEQLRLPLWAGLILAGVASLGLLTVNRDVLRVGSYFPELLRVPGLRRLFATGP